MTFVRASTICSLRLWNPVRKNSETQKVQLWIFYSTLVQMKSIWIKSVHFLIKNITHLYAFNAFRILLTYVRFFVYHFHSFSSYSVLSGGSAGTTSAKSSTWGSQFGPSTTASTSKEANGGAGSGTYALCVFCYQAQTWHTNLTQTSSKLTLVFNLFPVFFFYFIVFLQTKRWT